MRFEMDEVAKELVGEDVIQATKDSLNRFDPIENPKEFNQMMLNSLRRIPGVKSVTVDYEPN